MRGVNIVQGDNYTLYQGDCLDILPTLEAGSVDAVITDPPYGTTACHWDSVIPFEPMWAGIKHVLKARGTAVLFGSQPFTSALVMSNASWFRCEWVWRKQAGTGYLNANRQPIKNHESVVVFALGLHTYNPQKRKAAAYRATRGAVGGFVRDKTVGGYLTINAETGLHPTQKPIPLMEYLIKTYTNPGDTVLDFTMGSGTTGVAAMKTGRRFIGIELDPNYFQIAHERIANAAGEFVTTAKERATGQIALWDMGKCVGNEHSNSTGNGRIDGRVEVQP